MATAAQIQGSTHRIHPDRARSAWSTVQALQRALAQPGIAISLGAAALLVACSNNPSVPMPTEAAAAAAAPCSARSAKGPLFITEDCVDPVLNQPFIDVDEPRSTTDPETGVTVRYRYMHGGFKGSRTHFAYYFPSADQYQGRFFESTYPLITEEEASPDTIAFAISNGAYVVSTNNAGGVPAGGALAPYRANAAASKYSRVIARQVYGHAIRRPRGYLYGASGGAYQTIGGLENTRGVWDGGVPMVPGVPNAIPSFQASQLLALRVLADKLPSIADAMAPGGSGNPFADLDSEQKATLLEVTRLGFPLRGWWQYATLNGGSYSIVKATAQALDPGYANDFWTLPGYGGHDPAVAAARVQIDARVVALDGADGVILDKPMSGSLSNHELIVTSGPSAGKSFFISGATGKKLTLAGEPHATVAVGTTVRIDNSWLIALQYYARHQVPGADQYGWNQYRFGLAAPAYPQRAILVGPLLDAMTAGSVSNGHFDGKMIMLASTMDVQAYPWSADWYMKQAKAALGASFDSRYRLWYMDNADHDATHSPIAADHIVSYRSELQQALLYLDAWVVRGAEPPATTRYTIDDNNQIQLAPTAAERNGVQPLATLVRADGDTAPVAVGQPVKFTVSAEVPPGTGKIVKVEWDYLGNSGRFPVGAVLDAPAPRISLDGRYTFTAPGTYFPVVRVTAQREVGTPQYGLVQNLASVRVVVR